VVVDLRRTLMLLPLLVAQLAIAQDSTYSTGAVHELVSRAVVSNHAPPPTLSGYRAHVESELSLLLRDSLGRERAAQIEQLASAIDWRRSGAYEMHVVGYRMQTLGSPISTLSFVRGWTEPTLYGERLRIGVQIVPDSAAPRTSADTARRDRSDSIQVVHPFASDREDFYRYSGGDTVTVLRAGVRAITIVRLRVQPHLTGDTPLSAFDGEIDLDAERGQIVRMRGRFVLLGAQRSARRGMISRVPGLVAAAYVEFVNTEVNGLYWLPAYQRSEFQTTFALLGRVRAVMRIVSNFGGYDTEERAGDSLIASADHASHRTTWAPQDSVSRYGGWRDDIGDMTASVTADDFDDFAPDAWKSTGAPRVDFVPASTDNLVRFDRVQGLYTGVEANLQLRDMAPGVTVGALAGYAWSEHTVRGGVHASAQRGLWTYGARAERALPTTNDFVRPFEPQSAGLAGIVGSIDDFDYVDRRLAVGTVTRVVGSVDRALLTVQLGAGEDRVERARLSSGWIGGGTFRPNRGVLPGTYGIAVADAEFHPGLSGDFVQPGVGARLHVEAAQGALSWRRTEVSMAAREYVGPVSLTAEAQGGVVTGRLIPPQQLFELGGSATLPGYDYKQFAGDRAALFRGFAGYLLPLWRAPKRLWGNLFFPGVSPGLAGGIEGGYTQISSTAAGVAVTSLGASASGAPLSVASDRIRATTGVGVTFFSGIIHLGVARPIDHPAPWRFVIGGGPTF
jgi:hypothetical protein